MMSKTRLIISIFGIVATGLNIAAAVLGGKVSDMKMEAEVKEQVSKELDRREKEKDENKEES